LVAAGAGRGRPGWRPEEVDARRTPLPGVLLLLVPPRAPRDVGDALLGCVVAVVKKGCRNFAKGETPKGAGDDVDDKEDPNFEELALPERLGPPWWSG
jgi:hypothetical protein